MKKFLLSFLLLFTYQFSTSQCATSATNFGNNTVGAYEVTGDVTVTLNTDNTVSLNLGSNFMTADGPDIRAYLVNSNGIPNATLRTTEIANLTHIEFGLVSCTGCIPAIPANGTKTFNVSIPDGQDITDYDKVFFYCLQFNAFWDFGSFTPFSSTNCSSILSVDDNILNDISLYPNPTQNTIKISGHIPNLEEISIYNTLGKIVSVQKDNLDENIDLSGLDSGLYIMTLKTPDEKVFKRFIKQ